MNRLIYSPLSTHVAFRTAVFVDETPRVLFCPLFSLHFQSSYRQNC